MKADAVPSMKYILQSFMYQHCKSVQEWTERRFLPSPALDATGPSQVAENTDGNQIDKPYSREGGAMHDSEACRKLCCRQSASVKPPQNVSARSALDSPFLV